MNFRRVILLNLIICGCAFFVHAQKKRLLIDSLKQALNTAVNDTERVRLLTKLCWESRTENVIEAEHYGNEALQLGVKMNYPKAIASAYNNLGGVYDWQSNDWKALQYYLKALVIKRKLNDKRSIAATLNNIGIIYKKQEDFHKAISYYREALRLNLESGSKDFEIKNYQNLCAAYKHLGNCDSAEWYNERCIELSRKEKDDYAFTDALISKGNLLMERKKYREAILMYDSCLAYGKHNGTEDAVRNYYNNKGIALLRLGLLDSAEIMLNNAWKYEAEENDWETMDLLAGSCSELFYERYRLTKKVFYLEEAFRYSKMKEAGHDSLLNFKKQKSISDLITRDIVNQKDEELQAVQQKMQISELEAKNRFLFICMLSLVVAAIGIIAFITWKRLKKNKILTAQLAEKNKEITDSIRYAQRIQKSLLPSEQLIKKLLNKSSSKK